MSELLNLRLAPTSAFSEALIKDAIARKTGHSDSSEIHFEILKRSLDARNKPVYELQLRYDFKDFEKTIFREVHYPNVNEAEEVYIIGSGPAGLFAALKLIELGLKPVIFERGKSVRDRRRDLAALNKEHIVNPESNYCFGEGGAGTYSDGKLYTRSKKRGDVMGVLERLVQHGAPQEILIDAHPHIGTNKLPALIENMRETILSHGGEIHFEHKLTDLEKDSHSIRAIEINGNRVTCKRLILATGHSARDIFILLQKRNVKIEFKSFAAGVRMEHPQSLIDEIQYGSSFRPENVPPASYNLVEQLNGKSAYSFCMCPGGIIAPCATAPGEVVTNGWSPSKRNNPYANSGWVINVNLDDLKSNNEIDPLVGMLWQSHLEKRACEMAGGTQSAPAQRLTDFISNRYSKTLNNTSYLPGIISVKLSDLFPEWLYQGLQQGLNQAIRKMPKFLSEEAMVVAVESRTSSPVRIPRSKEDFQHIEVAGLYPCGEGAGYAGGIVSAAIDGEKVAEAIAQKIGVKI